MKKRALALAIYLLLIHSLLALVLTKSNFIEKVSARLGMVDSTSTQPLGNHEYYMQALGRYFDKRTETLGKTPRVIFIGDSIVNMLCVESKFNAINFGISGDTVRLAKKRVTGYHNLSGKTIVLAIGINDVPRENIEIVTDYRQLLTNLPKDSKVIISSVLPIDEEVYFKFWKVRKLNSQIDDLNYQLSQLAKEFNNVRFADTSTGLRKLGVGLDSNFHTGDGIHLNKTGYEVWGKMLSAAINER